MNNSVKKILAILGGIVVFGIFFFIIMNLFSNDKEVEYQVNGFQITLPSNFLEKDYVSLTAYLESNEVLVTALKEEFSTLEAANITSDSTLEEYANAVVSANEIEAEVQYGPNGKFMYFSYERTSNNKDFSYIGVVMKGPDAFWLMNFACESKNISTYRDKFLTWASTIKVS